MKSKKARARLHRLAKGMTGGNSIPLEVRLSHPLSGNKVVTHESMRWSYARAAVITDQDGVTFKIMDRPGTKRIRPNAPRWLSMVRSDTTDYLSRQAIRRQNEKEK